MIFDYVTWIFLKDVIAPLLMVDVLIWFIILTIKEVNCSEPDLETKAIDYETLYFDSNSDYIITSITNTN